MTRGFVFNFQNYLESKVSIDNRSFNPDVAGEFKRLIEKEESPVLLDLGTGTGLMLRHLLNLNFRGNIDLYGIDSDQNSIELARRRIHDKLKKEGYKLRASDSSIIASHNNTQLRITLISGNFFNTNMISSLKKVGFHAVTANGFMDIVPLLETVHTVRELLVENGLFYTTINYDGLTELLPDYGELDFENFLLQNYNESMDRRRYNGKKTGGSRTGSRLISVLLNSNFSLLSFGSSDWQIFPRSKQYGKGEKYFLKCILHFIKDQLQTDPTVDVDKLETWYRDRMSHVDMKRLYLLTHQTDILAKKEGGDLDDICGRSAGETERKGKTRPD
jgi:SAM-dependent methyltransferase